MRSRSALLALGALIVALLKTTSPTLPAEAAERHSGTVVKVDPQAGVLVLEELGVAGKMRQLQVRVPAQARLVLSERIPDNEVTDVRHPFKETPISLSDIRPGDFITVELAESGKAVASSVTVTFRSGSR